MSRSPRKRRLPRVAWLALATAFAIAPKCLLCVAGYVGLATALGLGGTELCGARHDGSIVPMATLALGGIAVGAAAIWLRTSRSSPEQRPAAAALAGRLHRAHKTAG